MHIVRGIVQTNGDGVVVRYGHHYLAVGDPHCRIPCCNHDNKRLGISGDLVIYYFNGDSDLGGAIGDKGQGHVGGDVVHWSWGGGRGEGSRESRYLFNELQWLL